MAVPTGSIAYPPELPVTAHREELLKAIGENQVVVVAGETGSGKTTQLPKLCLELGRGVEGQIAHTQPRRLAARTVAQRIADELGVELGGAVGYSVRFNDRASRDTQVRLMTDGLLLAEIQRDRLLRRYDTIIIDEAHERSLNIDFLLGVLAQILPRRPELKLIITSATIDPERFAEHFGGAPIVEVSGRTYPVETRYRPPAPETDPEDAIGDAVQELLREGPGDVLVFLSGEREIRDAAEALGGRFSDLEVLPLFARLSSAEQQRVFQGHSRRRVVLATNVAETSLTVPGIRYVVDPGTARISRYSARAKVQRLPIEPVSQASADQRKGRCGRTSDGICIRLYDEAEFLERPEFTDPEILRTSLASVILQMAALELGEIESFPFLDPPDRRQVRDGVTLLTELGALRDGRLTKLGRKLARLPVDPRLGRMVLEADRLDCATEVAVIVAGLSIQDPRERPADHRAQADQQHARFADEQSDFTGYLNLWRYWESSQAELSGSQLRKRCRREYLHFLRLREWQDLVGQLRRAAREVGLTLNSEPAGSAEIHRALLSGLLSHVGLRDAKRQREYVGARGARFLIFPGSALARRQPDWIMVSELVETSRLFGRDAARIDPRWIEPIAKHLVTRTYSEPRWSRSRGGVVATERVTLYGLPVVTGRTVAYGAIEPELCHELFLRHALVEGDWNTHHAFASENSARVREVHAVEDRTRRRDLLASEDARYEFFAARVPADVVSARHFDRWWRDARSADPELLVYPRELLLAESPGDAASGRPLTWKQGELELRLSYRFDPGSQADGVTVHVPLAALGTLRDTGFDWLVPALREELVTTLVRALPKELRRPLVPVPDTAREVVAALRPRKGRFVDAVARELEAQRGVRVTEWDLDALPAHLRMSFSVEDASGAVVAEGQDLGVLRARLRPQLAAELAAAVPELERHGLRAWDIGELPREVSVGGGLCAYPALVDEGATAGVMLLDTPAAQAAAMRAGTRRLLALSVPSPARWVTDRLDLPAQLALAGAPHATQADVVADAITAATDALTAEAGGPAWDASAFAALRAHVAGSLAERSLAVVGDVVAVLDAARELTAALEALTAEALQPARQDIAGQLGRLVFPGFVAATGAARLADVVRYLTAARRRAESVAGRVARDTQDMESVRALEAELAAAPRAPAALCWEIEELRVSLFAQALGVRGQVSVKRIRRAIEAAR